MELQEKISKLKEMIDSSSRIVVLTGAGISVPSGIPDFRSATGLYATKVGDFNAETMISHSFYRRYPDEFYRFYKEKLIYKNAKPNIAHLFLAKLESVGKLSAVVTQNIDGLHQAAGSKAVYELHGSVLRNYCTKCNKFFDIDYILDSDGVPTCDKCGGIIKPDVVLYEESLDDIVVTGAIRKIQNADMFIVIGTSLVVYPAAGLVNYFNGKKIAVLNKGTTSFDGNANIVINEDCAKVCKELIDLY